MSIAPLIFLAFCWRKYSYFLISWDPIVVAFIKSWGLTVEHRAVVTAITLRREGEAIARVLRECAHESLQRLPHVRGCSLGRVWHEADVGFGVCAAGANLLRIIGA
jgi:hypothetical protein